MNNEEREQRWSAYLDGELSAGESAHFDAALSATEKRRLEAEVRLEAGIAERLAQGPACPDELWQRTVTLVRETEAGHETRIARTWRYWAPPLASAAALVVFALTTALQPLAPTRELLALKTTDLAAFMAHADVKGDKAAVQAFLRDRGIALSLFDYDEVVQSHHHVQLLGACDGDCHGEPVVQLLYACCGEPVKVVVAKRGGTAERYIGNSGGKPYVQAIQRMGNYIAAVIGAHPAPNLQNTLSPTATPLEVALR